jgi:hypothetical protein
MTVYVSRRTYFALAVITIAAGLFFHFVADDVSPAIRDVVGDALWASMMFWWISAILSAARLRTRVFFALLICAVVELAQLYHSPLLTSVRSTVIGHLVLGSDFDVRDFAAYTVGVIAAGLLDSSLFSISSSSKRHA